MKKLLPALRLAGGALLAAAAAAAVLGQVTPKPDPKKPSLTADPATAREVEEAVLAFRRKHQKIIPRIKKEGCSRVAGKEGGQYRCNAEDGFFFLRKLQGKFQVVGSSTAWRTPDMRKMPILTTPEKAWRLAESEFRDVLKAHGFQRGWTVKKEFNPAVSIVTYPGYTLEFRPKHPLGTVEMGNGLTITLRMVDGSLEAHAVRTHVRLITPSKMVNEAELKKQVQAMPAFKGGIKNWSRRFMNLIDPEIKTASLHFVAVNKEGERHAFSAETGKLVKVIRPPFNVAWKPLRPTPARKP